MLPITLVTITGAQPNIIRDLDRARLVWGQGIGVWVEISASLEVNRPDLLVLAQSDCFGVGHAVSAEEDELFDLGRGLGADVVGYYIRSDAAGFLGCATHPPGRRGYWVGDAATEWTFIHEVGHVVGDNPHVMDSDNIMFGGGTGNITNPPPELNDQQRMRILDDPALVSVESIVLNL